MIYNHAIYDKGTQKNNTNKLPKHSCLINKSKTIPFKMMNEK